MKTDLELQEDVTAELDWDPAVNAARIGVAVKNGIVTLSGALDSHAQKDAVERAVARVAGVRGMAVALEVRLAPGHERTDAEIAQAAIHALNWHSLVPEDAVKVAVEHGTVRLTGDVDYAHERASAEAAVRSLRGVRGVVNAIAVQPRVSPARVSESITAALARHAQREAAHIGIEVEGSVVTLKGKVDSLGEHDAAIGTAHGTPGVSRVIDQLEVAA